MYIRISVYFPWHFAMQQYDSAQLSLAVNLPSCSACLLPNCPVHITGVILDWTGKVEISIPYTIMQYEYLTLRTTISVDMKWN